MNMKKILAVLLAVAMVLSMVVLPAAAVEETPAAPATKAETKAETQEANPTTCAHTGFEWTPVGEAEWGAGGTLTTGHYRLTDEVTPTAAFTVAEGQEVCIDLAGFNITMPGTDDIRAFKVAAGATLNIMDSTATEVEGVYTSGVISGGKMVSTGKSDAEAQGGNIYLEGTLNLYSGTISGGYSFTTSRYGKTLGGNIYGAAGSTLNIYGGLIADGNIDRDAFTGSTSDLFGGGNIASDGTVNISGGTITGGKLLGNWTTADARVRYAYYGGNIFLSANGSMTISGGTVSDGDVEAIFTTNATEDVTVIAQGGNICSYGTLNITGGTISGGYAKAGMDTTAATTPSWSAYARGGNIYIAGGSFTMSGGVVTGGKAEQPLSTADNVPTDLYSKGKFYIAGGNISIHGGTATISGGTISLGRAEEQNYSTTSNSYDYFTKGGNVYIGVATTISGGTISEGFAGGRGGNIYAGAALTMTGGTVENGDAGTTSNTSNYPFQGGNIFINSTSTISGGTVTGGYARYRGGNIWTSATLTVSGNAVLDGGSAGWGGNVFVNSNLKIYDNAKIINGEASTGACVCTSPSLGKVYVYGGETDAIRVGTGNSNLCQIFGGTVNNLVSASGTAKITIYNGILGKNPTNAWVASCAHEGTMGNLFYVGHAEGTCTACGHTYSAYEEDATCTTCSLAHNTLGAVHTYTDGACACGYAQPAFEATCKQGCENVTWTPWNGSTVANGGHYYLTDNMVLKAQVVINDIKVCIDLNGYTLTAAPAARAFDINSGTGVLTLMDSSTANTGKLRGFGLAVDANGGNIRVVSANLNLYDLTVSGGKITAADPNSSSRGGNIYSQTGVVLIDNAKVLNGTIETGGSIQRGGNICGYAKHTLIIKGENAKIAGGMLTNKSTNSFGGNIHSGTGGYLYIYDGEISGGYAKNGGNICWMNSDGTQRGTIHIYGGRILDTGKLNGTASGSNVEIYGSSSYQNDFYMYGGYIKSFDGSGSYNTITVYGGTLGINPRSATEAKKYVLAPCAVASYDAETKLYTVSHVNTEETCNICGVHDAGYTNGYGDAHIYTNVVENVTATLKGEAYTDLTAALAVAGEKDVVTMFADVAVDGYVDVYSVLDLNGHSLTATRVISAENSAAVLKDTVGTGTLSAEEGIITQADNGMLVIDPANNGNYVLETVEAVQKTVEIKDSEGNVDDDKIGIKFYIDKHSSLTQLDEAFKSEKGVPSGAEGDRKAYVRITVFSDELKDGSHSFVYGAEHLDAYASAWDAKIFTCQINGVKALGEYTVVAEVVSNGVVVAATEYVPA